MEVPCPARAGLIPRDAAPSARRAHVATPHPPGAGHDARLRAGFAGTGLTFGGQEGEGHVLLSAILSDEAYIAGTFNTRQEVSRRNIETSARHGTSTNGNLTFAERWLHRARRAAAAEAFGAAELAADPRRAEMLALAGFTYVLFGENYCSGMAFSEVPRLGGPPEWGLPMQTRKIFDRAISRFAKREYSVRRHLLRHRVRQPRGRPGARVEAFAQARGRESQDAHGRPALGMATTGWEPRGRASRPGCRAGWARPGNRPMRCSTGPSATPRTTSHPGPVLPLDLGPPRRAFHRLAARRRAGVGHPGHHVRARGRQPAFPLPEGQCEFAGTVKP
jgi:hypothetical protein